MLDEKILDRIDKKLDMIPRIEKQGALNKLALKNMNAEMQEHKKLNLLEQGEMTDGMKDIKSAVDSIVASRKTLAISKANTIIIVSVIIAALTCFVLFKGLTTTTDHTVTVVKELNFNKGHK